MTKEELKELKSNGIRWFAGMDINSSEYDGVWIKFSTNYKITNFDKKLIFTHNAKLINGSKYDYSKVDYKGATDHITITCPEHGDFSQVPASHLSGNGCNTCGKRATGDFRRSTTKKFIKKSRRIHGDRYDYYKVDYKDNSTYVTIKCSTHNLFKQRPSDHLSGKGCKKCASLKLRDIHKSATEEFIKKAMEKHGDRYDYSKVEYGNNAHTKVTIICPDHGEFEQTPTCHLRPSGCGKCGDLRSADRNKSTIETFIKKAMEKHGDRYDYSKVEYVNTNTKVKIICSDHGEFEQTPDKHLSGQNCSLCANLKTADRIKSTTEEFIKKAIKKHGDRYDYSTVDYVDAKTNVSIICPDHGEFEQSSNNHLNGKGCPICGGIIRANKKRITVNEFIRRAKRSHGNRYDYSAVDYKDSITNITINCLVHGTFEQIPSNHLSGQECPKCRRDIEPLTQVYLVLYTHIKTGKKYHKIGITEKVEGLRPYKTRKYHITLEDFFTVETEYARDVERLLLSAARSRYGEVRCPIIKQSDLDGKTEMVPYSPQLLNDFEEWEKMYEKMVKT